MNNGFSERREFPRFAVNLMVEYKSVNDFFVDYATDISHGGMFVATKKDLNVGTPVSVRFSLPDEKDSIEANGTVVRTGKKPKKGVGIRFEPLSNNVRDAIERLWDRRLHHD